MTALLWLIERVLFWAGLRPTDARRLAAEAHAADVRELRQGLDEDERRYGTEMERRRRLPHVVLGTSGGIEYLLPLRDLIGGHAHLVAVPGAGKTRFLVSLVVQMLRLMWLGGASQAIVTIDPKGETVALLMRAVAELLAALPAARASTLAACVNVMRPFTGAFLVPVNLLQREPSVDLVAQSRVLVELIERSAGAAVGIRQNFAGTAAFSALIANGIPFVEAPFVLRDARVMRELAMRVDEPQLRAYFGTDSYARESRQTIQGLLARIEAILGIAPLRAMLSGTASIDWQGLFAPGMLTLIDLDGSPLGAQSIADSIGALLVTRIGWASFAHGGTRAAGTWFIIDELSRIATPSVREAVSRWASQGRWLGQSLWTAGQFASQTPELDREISGLTRWRLFGRSSARELEGAAGEWLPITGRRVRPRRPGEPARAVEFMSEAEEARDWTRRIAHLPARTFLIGDRGAPFAARLVEALPIDPPAWDALDPRVRLLVERGGFGRPRAELLAAARAIETRAAERLLRVHETAPRTGSADDAPLPDLRARTRTRSRRRGVP